MKTILSTGRVQYEPKFLYQPGVLIGKNWYEETVHYAKVKHKHDSIYRTDFVPKEPNAVHPDIVWNNIIQGKGVKRNILMDHEGKNFHENYSSTCDLSYKWFPRCKKPHRQYSTVHLTYMPQQDLALNYGNVTNFGLRQQKKIQWDYENLNGSNSWTTEVRDNYLKPEPDAYYTKTIAVPKALSSKISKVNFQNFNLPLRGEQLSLVPDFVLDVKKREYPHFYF